MPISAFRGGSEAIRNLFPCFAPQSGPELEKLSVSNLITAHAETVSRTGSESGPATYRADAAQEAPALIRKTLPELIVYRGRVGAGQDKIYPAKEFHGTQKAYAAKFDERLKLAAQQQSKINRQAFARAAKSVKADLGAMAAGNERGLELRAKAATWQRAELNGLQQLRKKNLEKFAEIQAVLPWTSRDEDHLQHLRDNAEHAQTQYTAKFDPARPSIVNQPIKNKNLAAKRALVVGLHQKAEAQLHGMFKELLPTPESCFPAYDAHDSQAELVALRFRPSLRLPAPFAYGKNRLAEDPELAERCRERLNTAESTMHEAEHELGHMAALGFTSEPFYTMRQTIAQDLASLESARSFIPAPPRAALRFDSRLRLSLNLRRTFSAQSPTGKSPLSPAPIDRRLSLQIST